MDNTQQESKNLILDVLAQINQSENVEDKEFKFKNDIIDIYTKFKKWLNDNGAIYPNIEFPIPYLKGRKIGCKTTKNIDQNSAILYIPYKLIIDSAKIEVNTTLPSLSRHNATKIAYFLMKEIDKGQESFYKPYINLILSNDFNSYPVFWTEDDKIELDDGDFEDKISNYNDEINQTSDLMKKKTDVSKFEQVLFKKIYTFVISKQIVINENRSLLVPLVDLLNDNPTINVKYEIFDSNNFVMKYTSDLDKKNIDNNLLVYTNCENYFEHVKNIENKNIDKNKIAFDINLFDKKKFDLNETDYFVLSTNSEQTFKEGEQIFNNFGKKSNDILLLNNSLCLIDNINDSSVIILTTKQADKFTANFVLEHMMKNLVNLGTYDVDNYLQLQFKIPRNKISTKAFNFFKYINILGRMRFEDYVFIKKVELEILESYLNFLTDSIFKMKFPIFKAINILKDMIVRGTFHQNQKNIIAYKLTQKVNVEYQKEYIQFMLNVVTKCDENTKSYMELIKNIDEENDFKSMYLPIETIKKVVKDFIINKLPH
jgi:hypothetical protein